MVEKAKSSTAIATNMPPNEPKLFVNACATRVFLSISAYAVTTPPFERSITPEDRTTMAVMVQMMVSKKTSKMPQSPW